MSDIPLRGPDGVTRNVDTFERTVEGRTIHTQATANADPATGAHVPVATEASLQLLAAAADAIRAAAETLAGRPAGLTDTQLRAAPVAVEVGGSLLAATQEIDSKLNTTAGGAVLVGTSREVFRDEFLSLDLDAKWQLVQQGDGQTLAVNGIASGARYLELATGTTADAETILQSRLRFRGPVKVVFAVTSSQAIANQQLHVELVEVDDTGALVTDTSVFSSPEFLDARNGFGVVYDGTSQSNARAKVRSQGCSELLAVAATFGTNSRTATGTSPNWAAGFQTELLLQADVVQVQSRAVNSNVTATTPFTRTDTVPNPAREYALRVRVKNLATPASSTAFRLHFLRVIDASRLSVDFSMVGGSDMMALAAPVRVLSMPSLTVTANGGTSGMVAYYDSLTPLAVDGTFTGTSRDAGSTPAYNRFVVNASADQAGTVWLEKSTDNVIWRAACAPAAVTPTAPAELSVYITTRYSRVVYQNGPVAQGAFVLTSAQHRL